MERAPVTLFTARWLLDGVRPPVEDAALAVEDGRIVAAGRRLDLGTRFPDATRRDLGDAALLPGLVNAHTHLSLTDLAGTVPGGDFLEWLGAVARAAATLTEADVRHAVRRGLNMSIGLGTVAVGEITTRPEGTAELLAEPRMAARVFFEFLGVTQPAAERRYAEATARADQLAVVPMRALPVRPGLSPHAPYSVWPSLWREAAGYCCARDAVWSTHLSEHPGEAQFLMTGAGPLREYLERLGVWDGTFPVPGRDAVSVLSEAGALGRRALLVHGVHLGDEAIQRLAGTGASLCLCPRSNAFLGLPPPPVRALLAAGIPLCLGTDSAASNTDLSVWGEMRAVHALVPDLPVPRILHMATMAGARALGLGDVLGSLEAGRVAAALVISEAPARLADLEALLLSPEIDARVRRLDDGDVQPRLR